MSKDVARLILQYSQELDSPENIRDWFKKSYNELHKQPDWKLRLKAMVKTNWISMILKVSPIEKQLERQIAPALVWGTIDYNLSDNVPIDKTDLNKGIFHLHRGNTQLITIPVYMKLSESEKKYTTKYTDNNWMYFTCPKIREFIDYVLRFGLVPQLHTMDNKFTVAGRWWLRYDILLNNEL